MISRTGPTTAALTVNLTIAGTATNGTDYNTIARTVNDSRRSHFGQHRRDGP